MKRNMEKMIAVGLSGLLAAGLITGPVEAVTHSFAMGNPSILAEKDKEEVKASGAGGKITKQETVYVNTDASGNETKVLVSDWLKSGDRKGELQDVSSLKDIENVKGEEEYTAKGNQLVWNAEGKDIYYQGTTDKELPVGMEITYSLDGEEIKPEELAGKSGNVKIRIKYYNNTGSKKSIGGKKELIYTPFLMITGAILPVDNFSNVTVDNGTVLSEGENHIVAAYGMPGMKENLALDSLDALEDAGVDLSRLQKKLTDTVTIQADVTDFQLEAMYTMASSQFFGELELDQAEDGKELEDKLDELTDSTQLLVDGTNDIQSGTQTLKDSFQEYADAVGTLKKGTGKLDNGSRKLNTGVAAYTKGTDKLLGGVKDYVKGTQKLSKGVLSYTAGTQSLVSAVGQLRDATSSLPEQYKTFGDGVNTFVTSVNTLLSQENMTSLTSGASSLKNGVASLDNGLTSAAQGVKKMNETVSQLKETEELDSCVQGLEQMLTGYTQLAAQAQAQGDNQAALQYKAQAAALTGAIQYIQGGEQIAAGIDAATNGKDDGEADQKGEADLALALAAMQKATATDSQEQNLYTGASALETAAASLSGYADQLRQSSSQLTEGNTKISQGISALSTSVDTMNTGANTLAANNKTLDSGAKKLVKNGKTIKKNVKKITGSSKELRSGAKTLAKGLNTLYTGVKELFTATDDVEEGISDLNDGAKTLRDGMEKFSQEGIQTLADAVTDLLGSADTLHDRLSAVNDAAEDYQSFGGISKQMEGSVKFILSTEEITSEDGEQE